MFCRVALEHHVERRKGIFAENLLDLRAKTKDRFQLKQKPEKLNIFLGIFILAQRGNEL